MGAGVWSFSWPTPPSLMATSCDVRINALYEYTTRVCTVTAANAADGVALTLLGLQSRFWDKLL